MLTPVGLAVADEDDPLAPGPANLARRADRVRPRVRVRTVLDRQARALTEAGCIRIFACKQSGKTAVRPELAAHRTPRSAQISAAGAGCAVPPGTAISRNFGCPVFRLVRRQAEDTS